MKYEIYTGRGKERKSADRLKIVDGVLLLQKSNETGEEVPLDRINTRETVAAYDSWNSVVKL